MVCGHSCTVLLTDHYGAHLQVSCVHPRTAVLTDAKLHCCQRKTALSIGIHTCKLQEAILVQPASCTALLVQDQAFIQV